MINPTLEVTLISRCNFKCDYCSSRSNLPWNWVMENGKKKYIKKSDEIIAGSDMLPVIVNVDSNTSNEVFEDIFRTGKLTNNEAFDISKLVSYVKNNLSGWDIVISGGEPLLYPNIDYWLSKLTETNDVILYTNASLIQKFPKILQNKKVYLRIGFHPNYREMDEFFENMLFIKKQTDNYVVNYVLHPRHGETGKDIEYISFLQENDFLYEVTPFRGKYKGVSYGHSSKDVIYGKEKITPTYLEGMGRMERLSPGTSYLTLYSDGALNYCHGDKRVVGTLDDGKYNPGRGCDKGCASTCASIQTFKAINKNRI